MSSKIIYCPNSSSYGYTISVTFSESNVNIANNTSVISVSGYISATNVGFNEGNNCPLTISWHDDNGNTGNITSKDIHKVGYGSGGPNTVYISGSKTVTHKADGSLNGYATISFSKHQWASGWVPGSSSVSTSNTKLTTIARASKITECTWAWADGQDWVRTEISRASSNFTHTVEVKLGSKKLAQEKVTTTSKIVIPKEWCLELPDKEVGKATVTVITYNGNTKLGETSTQTDIKVPNDVVPTLGQVLVERIDGKIPSNWNMYVKNFSKVRISINNASGALGSTIKSYSILSASNSSSNKIFTSDFLKVSGQNTFQCTVTDSRNRVATKSISINVVDYQAPSIRISADRCDSSGIVTANGTSLKILPNYSISTLEGKNKIVKKILTCNNVSSSNFNSGASVILNSNCSIGLVYDLTATIQDSLGTETSVKISIPTAHRIINVRKNKRGIAFGGFSSKDEVEFFMNADFKKNVYYYDGQRLTDTRNDNQLPNWYLKKIGSGHGGGVAPAGSIKEFKYTNKIGLSSTYGTYTILETMLPWGDASGGRVRQIAYCNGTERIFTRMSNWDWTAWDSWKEIITGANIADIAYPIGVIYMSIKATSPAELFGGKWANVSQGRYLIGAGTSANDNTTNYFGPLGKYNINYAPEEKGGQVFHQLTINEMPKHNHGFYQYQINGPVKQWASQSSVQIDTGLNNKLIDNSGGDGSHNNMPPYYSVYIWKRIG